MMFHEIPMPMTRLMSLEETIPLDSVVILW